MTAARGYVVEFVGIPGAGKSTLSHAVAEELRRRGERVSEPTRDLTHGAGTHRRILSKLGFATRALIRHPLRVMRIVRAVKWSSQPTTMEALRVSFNLIQIYGLVEVLAHRNGIHLLDQGIFQGLWSVSASATGGAGQVDEIASLATSCAGHRPADRVVMLNPPPDLLVDRLTTRTGSRSRLGERIGTDEFEKAFEAAQQALDSVESLIGRTGIEMLAADASADQDSETFRRVASELAATLASD